MAQLMPLPLTVSCFSKIQTGFTFLVLAHPGSPGQRAVKCMCKCVCAVVEIGGNFALEIRENLAEVSCYRYNNGLIDKQCLIVFLFFRFRC